MTSRAPLSGEVSLTRILSPTDDEVDRIIQAMTKGFENEAFSNRFPIPASVPRADFHRALHMSWVGPALLEGQRCQLWIAKDADGTVLGVGAWSMPGHVLGETPEQKKYKDAFANLLSAEQKEWQQNVRSKVTSGRDHLYPSLWRDTYHLHFLATIPAARGKGVGGLIVSEMVRQAKADGKGMSLSTPTEPNRRFYERQGFRTLWESEVICPDGTREPYIVLVQDMDE